MEGIFGLQKCYISSSCSSETHSRTSQGCDHAQKGVRDLYSTIHFNFVAQILENSLLISHGMLHIHHSYPPRVHVADKRL